MSFPLTRVFSEGAAMSEFGGVGSGGCSLLGVDVWSLVAAGCECSSVFCVRGVHGDLRVSLGGLFAWFCR